MDAAVELGRNPVSKHRFSLSMEMSRLNRVLTYGILPEFRDGVHLFILNRHTPPSGQSRVYRVAQLRTDDVHCRESAGTGPVNLKVVGSKRVLPWQVIMDQLICASLSHTPSTIGMKWL